MPPGDNPTRPYTMEEKERALTALALHGGSVTRAREMLRDDPGFKRVPGGAQLSRWMRDNQGKYNELVTQVAPQIAEKVKHDYLQIVARSNETHLSAVELASLGLQVDDTMTPEERAQRLGEARDASQTAKNIAIAGGVAADKLALAEGRPTSITEHRDPDQLLRAIEAIAGKRDSIDGTAEEVTGASELASPDAA